MDYRETKRTQAVVDTLSTYLDETTGKKVSRERALEIFKKLHKALDEMYWADDFEGVK